MQIGSWRIAGTTLIAGAVLVLVLGIGAVWLLGGGSTKPSVASSGTDKSVTSVTTMSTKTTAKGGGFSTKVSMSGPVIKVESCGTPGCFDANYKSCSPATIDINAGIGAVQYQIYGPKRGGCEMRFRYTASPNPAWENKDMTCIFNNKLDLNSAAEEMFNSLSSPKHACTGPLASVLKSAGLK